MEITCPNCYIEFEVEVFGDMSECPVCGNGFIFDKQYTEDYSDCGVTVLWESNNYDY